MHVYVYNWCLRKIGIERAIEVLGVRVCVRVCVWECERCIIVCVCDFVCVYEWEWLHACASRLFFCILECHKKIPLSYICLLKLGSFDGAFGKKSYSNSLARMGESHHSWNDSFICVTWLILALIFLCLFLPFVLADSLSLLLTDRNTPTYTHKHTNTQTLSDSFLVFELNLISRLAAAHIFTHTHTRRTYTHTLSHTHAHYSLSSLYVHFFLGANSRWFFRRQNPTSLWVWVMSCYTCHLRVCTCVKWLINVRDRIHSRVWQDLFTCVPCFMRTWLLYMHDKIPQVRAIMSHITRMNESCRTHDWDISHV